MSRETSKISDFRVAIWTPRKEMGWVRLGHHPPSENTTPPSGMSASGCGAGPRQDHDEAEQPNGQLAPVGVPCAADGARGGGRGGRGRDLGGRSSGVGSCGREMANDAGVDGLWVGFVSYERVALRPAVFPRKIGKRNGERGDAGQLERDGVVEVEARGMERDAIAPYRTAGAA